MSHVAEVELYVKDLQALKSACQALGLEFKDDQTSYRWYGRYMGDSPLPTGFSPEELGRCEHAISVPAVPNAYEIGVVKRRDAKPGYTLLWDSWNGGYGLEEIVGKDACRLRQEYAAQVALKHLRSQGYRVKRQLQADGRIRLQAAR